MREPTIEFQNVVYSVYTKCQFAPFWDYSTKSWKVEVNEAGGEVLTKVGRLTFEQAQDIADDWNAKPFLAPINSQFHMEQDETF